MLTKIRLEEEMVWLEYRYVMVNPSTELYDALNKNVSTPAFIRM
jgi:hypothetical protein